LNKSLTLTLHRTKGKTLEQMDTLFGDQLVPHALQDPNGAAAAKAKRDEKKDSFEEEHHEEPVAKS
jgi:hypothetical protein